MGRRLASSKLIIGSLLAFIVLTTCFGGFIYYSTGQAMRRELGGKCIGIASTVAVLIEQDIESYQQFCKTLDTQSDYYRDMKKKLEQIRYGYGNDSSIAFLYTQIRISDTQKMYILDAESEHSAFFTPPGLVEPLTKTETAAYEQMNAYIPNEFVTDAYGTNLTCYVPVVNRESGAFIGLIGVDVSKDQYDAVMRNQLIIILGSLFLLVLLVSIALALSSNRVERMITLDTLTGVFNKAYFLRDLKYQIKQSVRKNEPLTVFMADLDHFKSINDVYGHPFGDIMLEAVAHTISCSLRKTDCLARYGGEEFSAYLSGMDQAASRGVVERIRKAVEELRVYNEEADKFVQITISIGVAGVMPGRSAQEALRAADRALYAAKRTRNAIAFDTDGE